MNTKQILKKNSDYIATSDNLEGKMIIVILNRIAVGIIQKDCTGFYTVSPIQYSSCNNFGSCNVLCTYLDSLLDKGYELWRFQESIKTGC